MMQEICTAATSALKRLDLTETLNQVAEARVKLDRLNAAIEVGDARRKEITAELAKAKINGPAVAEALMEGAPASVAALAGPGEAQLREEREALVEATRILRAQTDEAQAAIGAAESAVLAKIGEATQPILDALTIEAAGHAGRLVDSLASIAALSATTRCHSPQSSAARQILHALSAGGLIMDRVDQFAVPTPFAAALAPLEQIGALRVAVPMAIQPYDRTPEIFGSGVSMGRMQMVRQSAIPGGEAK